MEILMTTKIFCEF